MSAKLKHEIETTYINTWVETGAYSLVVNANVAAQMRRLRVDLVDVNFVLKTGNVVKSDMLEFRGLWEVRGRTVDGVMLTIKIAVISAECEVELLQIMTVQRRTK